MLNTPIGRSAADISPSPLGKGRGERERGYVVSTVQDVCGCSITEPHWSYLAGCGKMTPGTTPPPAIGRWRSRQSCSAEPSSCKSALRSGRAAVSRSEGFEPGRKWRERPPVRQALVPQRKPGPHRSTGPSGGIDRRGRVSRCRVNRSRIDRRRVGGSGVNRCGVIHGRGIHGRGVNRGRGIVAAAVVTRPPDANRYPPARADSSQSQRPSHSPEPQP